MLVIRANYNRPSVDIWPVYADIHGVYIWISLFGIFGNTLRLYDDNHGRYVWIVWGGYFSMYTCVSMSIIIVHNP